MIFNRASRDLDIIERDRVVPELLISFVPLTGNQHNVARSRERKIHEDLELSSGGYEFQPSRHLRRLSETQYSISQVDTQSVGRSQRRYRISHIKPAN